MYSKNVYFYHGFIILIGFVKYIYLLIRDVFQLWLTLNAPCISESCIEMKIKLKFFTFTLLCGTKNFFSPFVIGMERVNTAMFVIEKTHFLGF